MGTGVYMRRWLGGDRRRTRGLPSVTYIVRPIPTAGRPLHHWRMTRLAAETRFAEAAHGPSTPGGDAADLLRWARRLSHSAEAISTAAAGPGAAAAIAAGLAHIEAALEHLERGTEQMEGLARGRLTPATALLGDPWSDVLVARAARDFEDLAGALANARRACQKVRDNVGPMRAELTAV
jgi:hypothetical protein